MKDNLDTSAVVSLAEAVRIIKSHIGDEQTQHNLDLHRAVQKIVDVRRTPPAFCPWTAREVALAGAVALLVAVVAVLATEGLAQILLVTGGTP